MSRWVFLISASGVLARSKFYRIICDEAQFIRNRRARSSEVAGLVRAKHRWALSGTPVTNTLVDLYALLRFGRFRPWNDWKDFERHIVSAQITLASLGSPSPGESDD
jgi:SNF2 family DNA or RNA helicase